MFRIHRTLAIPIFLAVFATVSHSFLEDRTRDPVCVKISEAVSSASDVYYPGQLSYDDGIYHWASSSTQLAKCVVEPATAADVGVTLNIVGSTKTPFAVKGGGHATNPGFSSTTGVHISMTRFSEVTYNPGSRTAVIGAGLIWDDVYAALEPHGVQVVGGRVTGVGVAGLILGGGGYSWLTNQYGLTIDTVQSFELVKPDGTVVDVSETEYSDLFWGLKGGLNNFGIVTRFTLKVFPQGQVWGGVITILEPHIPLIAAATADFSANVKDPKAAIITTYDSLLGQPGVVQMLFYDGPIPPAGIFDDFLSIPYLTKDVKTRSYLSLVQTSPSNATSGQRGIFNTVSLLEYTPNMLDVVLNETMFWGTHLGLKTGSFVSYSIEPFLSNIYKHNTSPSAYPPNRSRGLSPLNIYFVWETSSFDADFYDAARLSANHILDAALAEGQTGIAKGPAYPNYAIFDTPLSNMYGNNVPRLHSLKASVDPNNVMGLAGGFKF